MLRANVLLFAIVVATLFVDTDAKKKGPRVTKKVFFDITIDGKDAGNVYFIFIAAMFR